MQTVVEVKERMRTLGEGNVGRWGERGEGVEWKGDEDEMKGGRRGLA